MPTQAMPAAPAVEGASPTRQLEAVPAYAHRRCRGVRRRPLPVAGIRPPSALPPPAPNPRTCAARPAVMPVAAPQTLRHLVRLVLMALTSPPHRLSRAPCPAANGHPGLAPAQLRRRADHALSYLNRRHVRRCVLPLCHG